MYNLYGITEVSCWASWYHIPDDALLVEGETGACRVNLSSEHEDLEDYLVDLVNDVPLGLPLLDTVMEVRDKNGKLVQEGMGQIYIGELSIQLKRNVSYKESVKIIYLASEVMCEDKKTTSRFSWKKKQQ